MRKDLDYFFLIQMPLRPSLCHTEVQQCLPGKGFPEDRVRGPSCHHCLGWGSQPRTWSPGSSCTDPAPLRACLLPGDVIWGLTADG